MGGNCDRGDVRFGCAINVMARKSIVAVLLEHLLRDHWVGP